MIGNGISRNRILYRPLWKKSSSFSTRSLSKNIETISKITRDPLSSEACECTLDIGNDRHKYFSLVLRALSTVHEISEIQLKKSLIGLLNFITTIFLGWSKVCSFIAIHLGSVEAALMITNFLIFKFKFYCPLLEFDLFILRTNNESVEYFVFALRSEKGKYCISTKENDKKQMVECKQVNSSLNYRLYYLLVFFINV